MAETEGMGFSLDTSKWEALVKQFEEMEERGLSIRPVAPKLKSIIQQDILTRFQQSPPVETGGVVWGEMAEVNGQMVQSVEWAKMSDFWLNTHPHRRGGQLLIDTGALMRASTSDAGGQVYLEEDTSISLGVDVPYAQKVAERRPFIFMHQGLVDKLTIALQEYLTTGEIKDA